MATTVKDVLIHAARNSKFRERLVENPKKVLADECDIHFFNDTSLILEEAKPDTVYFVLPVTNHIADLEIELKKNPKQPLLQINLKALQDEEFRRRLKADPKVILIDEYRAPLPQNFDVRVLEQTERRQHLLLPHVSNERLLNELELREMTSKGSKDLLGYYPMLFISTSEELSADVKQAADALSTWIENGLT